MHGQPHIRLSIFSFAAVYTVFKKNTTGLLAGCSYDVDETTCFGLFGGHHQVYKC